MEPKIPLMYEDDFSSPYFFASSTASLIETESGISSKKRISHTASLRTARSVFWHSTYSPVTTVSGNLLVNF